MRFLLSTLVVLTFFTAPVHPAFFQEKKVRLGNEVLLLEQQSLLSSRRIGVVSNAKSVLPNGRHIIDTLLSLGYPVTAVFSPEHGFGSDVSAGIKVGNAAYPGTEIPVYSLYGTYNKPTAEMLRNVDILVYDLQDVGARFYTYISTLKYLLEAGAESGKDVIILDRPNPLSGTLIDGPVLDTAYKSFVGIVPVPVVYGLTCGELAKFIVGEKLINAAENLRLTVVPMHYWVRSEIFDKTGLQWIKPSPNLPNPSSALIYPGTCLFESTNLSEGRGTAEPFQYIGAPFIDIHSLMRALEQNKNFLAGLAIDTVSFIPRSIPDAAIKPKHQDRICRGIHITIDDVKKLKPFTAGLALLHAFFVSNQDSMTIRQGTFQKLTGNATLYKLLLGGASASALVDSFNGTDSAFLSKSKKYLIY